MEAKKFGQEVLRTTGNLASFLVSRLVGGAWGELGAQYGVEAGGQEVHPASIQYHRTPEPAARPHPEVA